MSGEHVMLAEYHAPLSDDSKMEINIKIIDSKMILLFIIYIVLYPDGSVIETRSYHFSSVRELY